MYQPTITKDEYSRRTLKKLASDYFEGSMNRLVSFLVEKKELDADELNDLLDKLDDEEKWFSDLEKVRLREFETEYHSTIAP